MMITAELYILYGFLAFICLLLVTIIGVLIRLSLSIGRLEGKFNGLAEQMREMNVNLTARIDRLEDQMGNFREQLADFREQLGEVRGMMRALHDRMDLLTRHRHDDAGRVVITPEEVAAD